MLDRWMDGPGNRICEVVKTFQKGKSKKYAVLEVKDGETGETLFYQTTGVYRYSDEPFLKGEMTDPYLARPVYKDKESAIMFCKNKVADEIDKDGVEVKKKEL